MKTRNIFQRSVGVVGQAMCCQQGRVPFCYVGKLSTKINNVEVEKMDGKGVGTEKEEWG